MTICEVKRGRFVLFIGNCLDIVICHGNKNMALPANMLSELCMSNSEPVQDD